MTRPPPSLEGRTGASRPARGRSGDDPILQVRNLRKHYPVRSGVLNRHVGDVEAVDGVSFDLYPGKTLAVVGESGCGKSTMAETVLGLGAATDGEVYFDGEPVVGRPRADPRPLRREVQMIFQDPFSSLNERMTVGRIVREPLVIHGEREGEREAYTRRLLDRVGLDGDDHYDRYPHELSGGQRQRVSIARALALNPRVLVADEPVSALDVSIQAQILSLFDELQAEFGLTYLFISHDLSVVRNVADRVAVMYLGKFVEVRDTEALFEDPHHPYTEALLSNVPRVRAGCDPGRIDLEGTPPDPIDPPTGCRFHTRCHLKRELDADDRQRCESEEPELGERGADSPACHFQPE